MLRFTKQTFGKVKNHFYLRLVPVQKVDRETILKSSLDVFKTQGYHKTSMAELAKACGLLKGSIYHYFPSKQALMDGVIDLLSKHYSEKVFSISAQNLSTAEKLKFLVEQSERIFLENKNGCLMASIGMETAHVVPEFTIKIRTFFNNWINCLADIYSEVWPKAKALDLAKQGVAEIEGSVLLMTINNNPEYLHQTHNRLINRIKK